MPDSLCASSAAGAGHLALAWINACAVPETGDGMLTASEGQLVGCGAASSNTGETRGLVAALTCAGFVLFAQAKPGCQASGGQTCGLLGLYAGLRWQAEGRSLEAEGNPSPQPL
ncbi:hypothetical protein, partial [Stenotrophomonas sp. UBA7606]|uniref:hypothetical protein n=1 Tax=Stenotrophomonas sp. UBA7606 TaxID=1947559 RepID=UPI0025E00E63